MMRTVMMISSFEGGTAIMLTACFSETAALWCGPIVIVH